MEGLLTEELDFGSEMAGSGGLFAEEVGAEVIFVVIGNDSDRATSSDRLIGVREEFLCRGEGKTPARCRRYGMKTKPGKTVAT